MLFDEGVLLEAESAAQVVLAAHPGVGDGQHCRVGQRILLAPRIEDAAPHGLAEDNRAAIVTQHTSSPQLEQGCVEPLGDGDFSLGSASRRTRVPHSRRRQALFLSGPHLRRWDEGLPLRLVVANCDEACARANRDDAASSTVVTVMVATAFSFFFRR